MLRVIPSIDCIKTLVSSFPVAVFFLGTLSMWFFTCALGNQRDIRMRECTVYNNRLSGLVNRGIRGGSALSEVECMLRLVDINLSF